MESKPNHVHLYLSVFILNIMYFLCGTTFAWSSPVLVKLRLPDSVGSSVAAMLSLGSVLGPFVSGALLNVLGRKVTAALSMSLISGSYMLLTLSADNVTLLSLGRFIAGVGVGIVYSAVPMYIAEISEDSVRGLLNTVSQISTCSGSLLVYAVGPFVSYMVLHYILLGVCGCFFLLFPILPNSPYSLVLKNDIDQCREVLTWLRKNRSVSRIEKELQIIQILVKEHQEEKGSIKELVTSAGNRRALSLCLGLLILQQLSGVTIVFFYAEKIFQMTGSTISSATCSIVLGIIMTASGFIAPVAVKYQGYKKPLLASTFGMALGMGGLGVYFLLMFNHFEVESINWMPLLSVVIFITFFNTGFANIPWALTGELFPSNVRPIATTVIAAVCGAMAYLVANFFPDLINLLKMDFLCMTCSFFCVIAVVFVSLLVQDTSGLSFAQIQEILSGRKRKEIQLRPSVAHLEDCKT